MVLFGAVGLFRRMIPLTSGLVSVLRGYIGALFLLAVKHRKPDISAIRRNRIPLLLGGALMGFNWILLFEAYNHTTVATATLCYYMAPVFVTAAAPFVLRERLTWVRGICILAALGGMILVNGGSLTLSGDGLGAALGLGAAALYAGVILSNKKLRDIESFDCTVTQLTVAATVTVPYVLLAERPISLAMGWEGFAALAVVCLLITGVAYLLYFGSMRFLPAQTVAVLGYVDPAVAVLLSALVLREPMTPQGIVGAVLILGAAAVSELFGKRKETP